MGREDSSSHPPFSSSSIAGVRDDVLTCSCSRSAVVDGLALSTYSCVLFHNTCDFVTPSEISFEEGEDDWQQFSIDSVSPVFSRLSTPDVDATISTGVATDSQHQCVGVEGGLPNNVKLPSARPYSVSTSPCRLCTDDSCHSESSLATSEYSTEACISIFGEPLSSFYRDDECVICYSLLLHAIPPFFSQSDFVSYVESVVGGALSLTH